MANLSNVSKAFGSVTITAPNKDLLAQLLYLHARDNETVNYDTTLIDVQYKPFKDVQEYVNKHAEQLDNQVNIRFDFNQMGRWNFPTHIKKFFAVLTDDHFFEFDFREELKPIAETLKQYPFEASFDVNWASLSRSYILQYQQEIEWKPEIKGLIVSSKRNYTQSKMTASNLIQYGFYEKGEVWDMEYVYNNLDFFIEELRRLNVYNTHNEDTLFMRNDILNDRENVKLAFEWLTPYPHVVCYHLDTILHIVFAMLRPTLAPEL